MDDVLLRLRLDTLGDHINLEAMGELNHRSHDRRVSRIFADVRHEAPVDLDAREGIALEHAKRSVAGPEVVECDADAECTQLAQWP